MKLINKVLFSGFVLTVLFACLGFSARSEFLSDKIIRMHVKANSDTAYDQEIKLAVKDEIVDYTQMLIEFSHDKTDALAILSENLDEINQVANTVLDEIDSTYCATVSLKNSFFSTREYETFTLPAGDYMALTVDIGSGEGENWWCVVYPSLCEAVAIEESKTKDLSEEEIEMITETPKISFKIYEWYLELLEYFS